MKKQYIAERFNCGDCEGLEALKSIASKEDIFEINRLIDESWKVVESKSDDEEKYLDDVRIIFNRYGFEFDSCGEAIE